MARTKLSKKSKRSDSRPARAKYWSIRKLEARKVANLMRCRGMTKQQAYRYWHEGSLVEGKEGCGKRLGRVPEGYLRKVSLGNLWAKSH